MIDEGLMLKKAYEQGRADATEWHYPSKGEYPDKGKVLICLNELDEGEPRMEIATLEWTGKFFLGHNCNDYLADEIRAWMPLPDPPKEEA